MLTSRWSDLRYHAIQQAFWNSPHRFNVLPCGRRSGKTELVKRKLVTRALIGTDFDNPRFFAGAPTRSQAKNIFWTDLKLLIPDELKAGRPLETDLILRLINGSEIHVVGLDRPERIEGSPWDGGVIDERANTRAHAFEAHVRPALSDRRGWCDLIGVPEGRNHYYDEYTAALAAMQEQGEESVWGAYHWISADILPAEEVEAARADMDELTFLQEFEASFINFEGQAYYPFDQARNCAPLNYNPRGLLIFCFDFNVDPGTATVIQEQTLPNGLEGSGVIGEVHIPRNSNTPAVCRRLAKDWGDHQGRIVCYGDATGGARGTAKIAGNDWDLIKAELKPVFGERMAFKVQRANPPERSRLNAANSRLRSSTGQVRLMVDAKQAPNVVRDFEGVRLLAGGSGEIDKKADPNLTHLTDGIGYYVVNEFPVADRAMKRVKLLGV